MTRESTSAAEQPGVFIEWWDSHLAVLTFDMPGKSANVMTTTMLEDFERSLDELDRVNDLQGIVLVSAKPKVFVAGADLVAIARSLDWEDEPIIAFCRRGQLMFERLRQRPAASLALIDGACLGGGLELALACDYRIATSEPRTILGLPEVKLGLIPGWAGTVRLPRLIGLERGGEWLTSGRIASWQEAHSVGLVDEVVGAASARERAERLLREVFDSAELRERRLRQRQCPAIRDDELARIDVAIQRGIESRRAEIYPFAPRVVWEQVVSGISEDFDDACQAEARAMCRVWGSPACRGLLNVHFLGEHNKKKPGRVDLSTATQSFERIGLIGLGVMGHAIAQVLSRQGVSLWGWDSSETARRAFDELGGNQSCRSVESLQQLQPCDLIIEAIVEDVAAKQQLFAQLAPWVRADAVLASNTSTIPLKLLGRDLPCAARLVGIHFCHPQLMSLVEVVRSDVVEESVVASAVAWVRRLGKSPVVVADVPGFVVNRLLAVMFDTAIRRLEMGESHGTIDAAFREFGYRAGPFEIMDIIGIDTVVRAGKAMMAAGGEPLRPSPILPKFLRKGRLGRKSGAGFYRYSTREGPAEFDNEAEQLIAAYQMGTKPSHTLTIADEAAAAMLVSACDLVDESVVSDPRDVDWCLVQGLAFPAHRGGLFCWADQQGAETVKPIVQEWLRSNPKRRMGSVLERWLAGAGPFYAMV